MLNRQKINNSGLKGLVEKYINDNFEALFNKLSGGKIAYSDLDLDTQNKINTQTVVLQTTDNLNASSPMEYSFYIPEDTKEVKDVNISVNTTNNYTAVATLSIPSIEILINGNNVDNKLQRSIYPIDNLSIKEACNTGWNNLKISGLGDVKATLYIEAKVIRK